MIKYLLDTNILVDIIRGNESHASAKLLDIGLNRCAIADLTVFELLYGAFVSEHQETNLQTVQGLTNSFTILSSAAAYREAAKQKSRLRQSGMLIEDIDLLIGCTSITNNLILVTDNIRHMGRLENIQLDSWD